MPMNFAPTDDGKSRSAMIRPGRSRLMTSVASRFGGGAADAVPLLDGYLHEEITDLDVGGKGKDSGPGGHGEVRYDDGRRHHREHSSG